MSVTIIALGLIILFAALVGMLIANQATPIIKQTADFNIGAIEALLPQTQCTDCGFTGCEPYASAIIKRQADINRCLPGGNHTLKALSVKLGVPTKPLYKKTDKYQTKQLAIITEDQCIGCVKCIAACPVDAILGARGQMHSIINAHCTGCGLCIAPCPVDCISLSPIRSY